jgi:hypothetical protein
MIKVLPIQSKADQELDCARCGIPFRPDALAYRATVNDVFVGMCQFKLTDKGGEIYDIVELEGHRDFEAMFVMGRAALNFIDLCGVHYAYVVADNLDESLLRAIGFSKNADGIFDVDLTDFFVHPCQHHKQPNPYDTPKQ